MINSDHLENFEIYFPQMQVDRSAMQKGEYVPIHTHDGHFGFLYILSGSVLIETYASQQVDDKFYLELQHAKIYGDHDYAFVTKKDNVHSIKALEDTMILDVFSVQQNSENVQKFLRVVETKGDVLVTVPITVEEAEVSPRLLTVETLHTSITE